MASCDASGCPDLEMPMNPERARVLLCRHCAFERLRDPDGRLRERMPDRGVRDAETLAERIAALPGESVLYCGPRERAIETARPLATRLERTLYTDPDLDELRLGRHPDLDAASTARIWEQARSRPDRPALPGAETFEALGRRGLATLRGAVRAAGGRRVIAVTHGGLIEAVLQVLDREQGRTPRARTIDHGSITAIEPWPGR
jgi:broad specificity phosphatase PhoE